jgi:hypothetical protein
MEPENAAERYIAEAFASALDADLRDKSPRERSVRGEFLSSLLLGATAARRPGLRVTSATITGEFNLAGASVDVPIALIECTFLGAPTFTEARLRSLNLGGSNCPGLVAQDVQVEGSLRLDEQFQSVGKVNLTGARIEGTLRLNDATLRLPDDSTSHVDLGAPPLIGELDEGFGGVVDERPILDVEMPEAEARSVDVDDPTDDGSVGSLGEEAIAPADDSPREDRIVLDASLIRVSGSVHASGLKTFGRVELISARIDGLLSLMGAELRNSGDVTLQCERLQVGESVFLHKGFSSDGCLFFRNAIIKGGVDLAKAILTSGVDPSSELGNRRCVNLVHATVGRNLSFAEATIRGSVDLTNATVASVVTFREASFRRKNTSLRANRLTAACLNLRLAKPPKLVTLRYGKLELIEDDENAWPTELLLDGCTYRMLDSKSRIDVDKRLHWLHLDTSPYKPFRYDQLIASFRMAGDEPGANRVGLEKQRHRTKTFSPAGQVWGRVQAMTVGYGYRNALALLWIGALIALGAGVFYWIEPRPANHDVPPFNSIAYAADLLLPVVGLGVKDNYMPVGHTQLVAYGLMAAGWILTTVIVAGVTRLLSRPNR